MEHYLMNAYNTIKSMRKAGYLDAEIAGQLGIHISGLRSIVTQGKKAERAAKILHVVEMKAKGHSNVAIAEDMGISESTVRALLKEA